MTSLDPGRIERYSRQIILPEVGGRGQERLFRARVVLAGGDDAATATATLLGRAGVGALDLVAGPATLGELSPDCRVTRRDDRTAPPDTDVIVDLRGDVAAAATLARRGVPLVLRAGRGAVVTLVGRPCIACFSAPTLDAGSREPVSARLDPAMALAVGALAASETLVLLLGGRTAGRVQRVDGGFETGVAAALAGEGCARCRVDA